MEDYFQRSVHSCAKRIEGQKFLVESTMFDLEHLIRLELTVDMDTATILDAVVHMDKTPFERCRQVREGAKVLKGLVIERGVLTRINKEIGGERGCVHLGEVISEAIRMVSMLLIGEGQEYRYGQPGVDEEETIAKFKPRLRGTCIVFSGD